MGTFPEPTWADGQVVDKEVSSLCETGIRPTIMTGIIIRLVQAHFYNPDNIEDTQLRDILWSNDTPDKNDIESKIYIGPTYKYEPRTIQQRPAIMVNRGELKIQRNVALMDKSISHLEADGSLRGEKYRVIIHGSHEIKCIAGTSMACGRLSEEVFYRMLQYMKPIQKDIKVGTFAPVGMSPPQMVDESQENYLSVVGVSWSSWHTWEEIQVAPILKKVTIDTNLF